LLLLLALALLAACGKNDPPTPSVRIAARVNGDAISVRDDDGIVRDATSQIVHAPVPPEAIRALDRLIDQELLVQEALATRLDHDPQVRQAVEAAKRSALAQARLERTIAPASRSSPDEIRQFYRGNPDLFERRRIYRFREISAAMPAGTVALLDAERMKSTQMEHFEDWFRSRNVQYDVTTTSGPAEQIPLDMLHRLATMNAGDIAVVAMPEKVAVVQLLQAEDAPLSEAEARPVIEQFLSARKRAQLSRYEIERLREKARIEYVGEYQVARSAANAGRERGTRG